MFHVREKNRVGKMKVREVSLLHMAFSNTSLASLLIQ